MLIDRFVHLNIIISESVTDLLGIQDSKDKEEDGEMGVLASGRPTQGVTDVFAADTWRKL